MRKPSRPPDAFEQLDDRVQELRKLIGKGESAIAIGPSLALFHLDAIARIRAYSDQLDAALGYKLYLPDQTLEENLPRMNTALRILAQLNSMQLGQIACLLGCIGGPEAIAVQHFVEFTKGDPGR